MSVASLGCVNVLGTSVYQITYAVVSAYSGALFLTLNGVVSPTRTMFVHKVHVSP
jgi:hypothetical protein